MAFSWSQAGAHDHHDDFSDHHHDHDDDDDWEEAYAYVGIGIGVAAGLTVLGAILFPPLPPSPHLLENSQKTPPKIILEGGPTGIRIRF